MNTREYVIWKSYQTEKAAQNYINRYDIDAVVEKACDAYLVISYIGRA